MKPLPLRVLEFLNLLEDGKDRLSWTKIALVVMLGLAVYTVLALVGLRDAGSIAGAAVAGLGALGTLLNYAHQRYIFWGQTPPPHPMGFGRGESEHDDVDPRL